MQQNQNLRIQALSEIEKLKVHGRTTGVMSPLTLFHSGSALELNARGTELWIEVEVDYDTYEPWINIVIDSVSVSRMMLTAGRYWVCVFRGMNRDIVKNIRVVRELQAMSGDTACCLQLHRVKFDGEFLPVEDKPYKLEFIGDSITSGEGAVGATKEEDWISMWFSAVHNYCYMTAEALNADYRVLSQSGWGVHSGWDNNPNSNIPVYYEKVCGLLQGTKNEALGAFLENDFTAWQPDIIVVNLGTNDAGAFEQPEWKDPLTGELHKQRINEDGSYNMEDLKKFEEASEAFLFKLRRFNPKAQIVWAYGMIGIPMLPSIYRAVDTYQKKTGDRKVSIFQLPNTTDETIGARWHPGLLAHKHTAKELSEYLKQFLNA